jgi:hypothetical protein
MMVRSCGRAILERDPCAADARHQRGSDGQIRVQTGALSFAGGSARSVVRRTLARSSTSRPHPVELRFVAVCRSVPPNPSGPKSDFALQPGLNFRLRMADCIVQCLNLEHEIHHTASKQCILGFEPLK